MNLKLELLKSMLKAGVSPQLASHATQVPLHRAIQIFKEQLVIKP